MTRSLDQYARSKEAYQQALQLLPGGVNSPVRAFRAVQLQPIFIDHGQGPYVYDIDGNRYIDYVCSWGPLILGHAHPAVVEAVRAAAGKGTTFGAPTEAETALAEKIIRCFDSIEKLRMVSSGTEAVMTAVRLARAYSRRDLIVKMAGCYHGHSDSLLVSGGSGLAERSVASSAGVPHVLAELTIVVPYNDSAALEEAFDRFGDEIAAVLVEPIAANMGVVPPVGGYLQRIRQLCDQAGAVLIFDEVITGFRVALGGAQQLYGLKADLTCLGKIVGGGLPAAAVGGRAEIMELLAPEGPVYQAGTLSGNPLATAAANATLDVLMSGDCYDQLEKTSAELAAGLVEAAEEAGVAVTINRVGSLMSCFFTGGPIRNLRDVQSSDTTRFKKFFREMLRQGIYLAPSAYEAMFVSLAHGEEQIDCTIESARASFAKIADK